ncbi:MAG: hypothetical protein PWQ10_7 [Patescibacteria group bacterium]|nr:hypothetical protein [Patescibacteria group bacterium]
MKKHQMKATSLQKFMIVSILLLITVLTLGFYFTQNWLNAQIIENNKSTNTSATAIKNSASILKLQNEITIYQTPATKANLLFTPSQNYQNQTIDNLEKYASINNISIKGYSFNQQTFNTTSSSITITLNDSIKFTDMINFLKAIETSIPKMQLTGINIKPTTGIQGYVEVEPLTIEIYTR